MDYLTLVSTLRSKKMFFFSLRDIRNFFPEEKEKTLKNNLTRWNAKGYFLRLKKDLYELGGLGKETDIPDLYVANRLYEPSYVSLETALSIYNIIPDIAAGVTSVTTKITRTFKNKYGVFYYKTCKKNAFCGYKLIVYEGFKINMADQEKALVDFLYYRLRFRQPFDLKEERFNKTVLRKMSWSKALSYARLYNTRTVKTVKMCKEYVKC